MTTAQDNANEASRRGGNGCADAFETRDFYLACFLRCTGYELLDLRDEGRRKVFVFQDRPTRRDDVMAFYGEAGSVRPLAFAGGDQRHEGAAPQCVMFLHLPCRAAPMAGSSARLSIASKG